MKKRKKKISNNTKKFVFERRFLKLM